MVNLAGNDLPGIRIVGRIGINALIPNFLRRLSTDEYAPQPYGEGDRRVIARLRETLGGMGDRYRIRAERWLPSSSTAAGLISLNKEYGERFYEVSDAAIVEHDQAKLAFRGDSPVI